MDKLSDSLQRDINKLQTDYHKAIEKELGNLDIAYLRKIQANYFQCGLKCCEDPDASITEVQHCVERCEVPLSKAHEIMQSEVSSFQARLQLCASECANQARDKLPSNATESQLKNAQREILACSQKCVDNQLSKGLPALIIRLKDQLRKLKQNQIHIAN
ncbi:hypothetical protein MS3_00006448 [Schistosoma haematobium]|uniref:Uncharacterized protein n=1 Tax=Schistosoma haematobium TaxID=6185 RepID=A0A6A5DLZ9_SCHHA|nr:hypothetical protein MS3_00006448 [Schistosoma haematobium]KAH9585080.1 hypothetical protein MS3_00006448 [Schistosoma haematobium]CAH8511892.1 unnamed protein product [Schistosoma haematobium]CAH8515010.1 unnamed protein product [Schistosoma haematobium]